MSRFLFIKNNDKLGDLLLLNFCKDCKTPQDISDCIYSRYPGGIHGNAECFTCGKPFDGNTCADQIIIELESKNK